MLEFIKEAGPMLRFLFDINAGDASFNITAIGVWLVIGVGACVGIKEVMK